jgi:3-oxoacyl-[acyl-carrier-protein] synthase-1
MSTATRPDDRRVVITGMGIVSCLGNTLDAVAEALHKSRCGVARIDAWAQRGFVSQVAGAASLAGEPAFDRKFERFMGDTARFACHATRKAIDDAGLPASALRSPLAGAVIGSGAGALSAYDAAIALVAKRGIERAPPFVVPQAMSSTVSANVAHVFGLGGVCYTPSSACTTSTLAIGQAMQLIQSGRQQIVLTGGSDELHENTALMFGAMGVLSSAFNDAPGRASRPYDALRDGFVLGSGAGVLVLESLAHARARGASIYAELTGFGQATDAHSMVAPGPAGMARAIQAALDEAGVAPDYVNTHAPSTQLGDAHELEALSAVFGERVPPLSSTKALTGHPLAAAGAHEAIYTLLMMRDGFIAASAGIESLDACAANMPIVRSTRPAQLDAAMSVSFGFGGSCASLMFGNCKGA